MKVKTLAAILALLDPNAEVVISSARPPTLTGTCSRGHVGLGPNVKLTNDCTCGLVFEIAQVG